METMNNINPFDASDISDIATRVNELMQREGLSVEEALKKAVASKSLEKQEEANTQGQTFEYNLENFMDFFNDIKEQQKKAFSRFQDILRSNGVTESNIDAFSTDATKAWYYGAFMPNSQEYFTKGRRDYGLLEKERDACIEAVMDLNRLARLHYYLMLQIRDKDEIEKEKKGLIERYKRAKETGAETKLSLQNNPKWEQPIGDMWTFATAVKRNGLGDVYEKDISDRYDNEVAQVEVYLADKPDHLGRINNKESFEAAQRYAIDMIAKLENMSVEDFIQYRIGQMRLTPEEKELFDQQINEYVESKKPPEGPAGHGPGGLLY